MNPPQIRKPNAPTRVLLVEDYQDAREMYADFLRYSGFVVDEATNGQEALDRAFLTVPDVVLMDLSLPVMDGWTATRRLKADRRTSEVPVIAVTGHALARNLEEARIAGCDELVVKPCLPPDLVDTIHLVLDRVGARARQRTA